jgi:hypothetical protein
MKFPLIGRNQYQTRQFIPAALTSPDEINDPRKPVAANQIVEILFAPAHKAKRVEPLLITLP